MRYWVYQDSQILGPLEPDEMARLEALGPETLVCQEEAGGGLQSDWRALDGIPELSGLRPGPVSLVGNLPEPEPPGSWLLEDRELYSRHFSGARDPGPAEEAGPSLWWDAFDRGSKSKHVEVAEAQARANDIEKTVAKLHARIEELENQQGELLRQLLEKSRHAPAPAALAPQSLPVRAPAENKPPEPSSVPPLPEIFSIPVPTVTPPPAPVIAPEPAAPPPVVEEPAPVKPVFKASAPKAWPSAARQDGPAPKIQAPSKFAAPKAFARAAEEGPKKMFPVSSAPGGHHIPPAARHQPAAAPPSEPPSQIPGLAPRLFLAPADAGLAPPPSPFAPPVPLPPTDPGSAPAFAAPPHSDPPVDPPIPPLTGPKAKTREAAFEDKPKSAPAPLSSPPASPFSFVPAPEAKTPARAPAPAPSANPPMTMSFSSPSIPPAQQIPPSVPPPPGADIAVHTQEVLSRLAKPRDTQGATAPKAKKRQSKFALIISASFAGLIVLAVLFFRNTKEIKLMFNMGASQRPLGAETEEAAGARPQVPAPSAAPQTAAPAPKTESVADPSPAAIELVKQYPLDGGRGTVGQWLQYSFAANPGDANKEKWNAGAVSAATYLVQYTVPAAGSAGGTISYLFEADLQAKTVKGNNPDAKRLLSPQTPAAPKAVKKTKPARKRPAKARPAKKAMPLLALPTDSDLAPPADDSSQFPSDTVN